jgi:hypothetical protein
MKHFGLSPDLAKMSLAFGLMENAFLGHARRDGIFFGQASC